MRFEISRLIGYPRITGGVRFVESIFGKFSPVAPDLFQFSPWTESVFLASFHELYLQSRHFVHQFFTHCLAQFIGLTARKSGQIATQ